jgi:DNA-binding NarL/FixJ family response regulator
MDKEINTVQSYINRANRYRDIYHDLMPYKVKEILLVSHLYDAYLIEGEGRFSEIMLYDYGNLNLTSLPRITGASFDENVFDYLEQKEINLVILMVGLDKDTPLKVAKKIRHKYPDKPIFFLLNDNTHEQYFLRKVSTYNNNMVFVWNGESRIFFAMIKYLEDKMNAKNDTKLGSVRLILIVEDSPTYYSAYLSNLYQIIFDQTNKIIEEIWTDNVYKVLKLRTRPKILLAKNYEEAIELFNEYKDFLYCLLTDVRYKRNNRFHKNAGFELITEVKKQKPELPIIVMSSEKEAEAKAKTLNAEFINKNSEFLLKNLKIKVIEDLNFGDFVFRDKEGVKISKAKTIKEFEKIVRTIPDETIIYHAAKDNFSQWLMARSEIQLAKVLMPKKANEFETADEIREFLLETIKQYRDEKPHGNLIPIDELECVIDGNIVSLRGGAFGGKGRGLTFANSLLYQFQIENKFEDISIKLPKTAVIGIHEYEEFISKINLKLDNNHIPSYDKIKHKFLKARLSKKLNDKLKKLLDCFTKPLAVRSSGAFEDSISQPFAGIFETYVIPNNHSNKKIRLNQLAQAIKLVFASVFSEKSINYAKALDQRMGEEKMAIVIQELVGHQYDNLWYPHVSGVAQSYNFYPFANMKPEDGFAVIAFGLGMYVVNGENAYRFSPKHPRIQVLSLEDQIKFTQTYFYALNMDKQEFDLINGVMETITKIDIYEARKHNTLTHCASVFDNDNQRMYPGVNRPGPIVVDFASILKNDYIPLSDILNYLMKIFEKAFGTPIEIEYAIDLKDEPVFYLLQVKPLIKATKSYNLKPEKIKKENTILFSKKIMGNGEINYLRDLIFVKEENFNKTMTNKMVPEISALNKKMKKEGKQYVLIGPGRWGTRDRFLGIPVIWPQISEAKVIVETDLDGYPLDASYGSHFFHNLTNLNIAYFSVVKGDDSYINYDLMQNAEVIEETTYFKHIKFKKPLLIKMDGKQRMAIIEYNNGDK